MSQLTIETTPIPDLLVVRLPVHGDARGWFKEAWQREKMTELGLPDFGPVQSNMSFNKHRGTTRGIHAEPWDKLVTVAAGSVFGAWVDLRDGRSFGTVHTVEVDTTVAVFVPRGVGNAYQALEDETAYCYLVNDHWQPGLTYPALALDDPTAAIPWPIPLDQAEISEKDQHKNPTLDAVTPMARRRPVILGGNGQLGRALAAEFPEARVLDRTQLDLADPEAIARFDWQEHDVILNAAAYTSVDDAETPEGRRMAWATNAVAPSVLAQAAAHHGATLVHYSTDYVFDGSPVPGGRDEDAPLAPLGVYGQSKAAGEIAAQVAPHHYVLRTSWVIGDGQNFVRTMQRLAADGVSPTVVDDQIGRLSFTEELARATRHLLDTHADYGVYNVTNSGRPHSWADYARQAFMLCGRDPDGVTPVSTDEYASDKSMARRPGDSVLNLNKLTATGFVSTDANLQLATYLESPPS